MSKSSEGWRKTLRLSAQHAKALQQAIANYRLARKLLRDWETETERLIDAEHNPAIRRFRPGKFAINVFADVRKASPNAASFLPHD